MGAIWPEAEWQFSGNGSEGGHSTVRVNRHTFTQGGRWMFGRIFGLAGRAPSRTAACCPHRPSRGTARVAGSRVGVRTLNGVTTEQLDALNPAIMGYITHLHVAIVGFIAARGNAISCEDRNSCPRKPNAASISSLQCVNGDVHLKLFTSIILAHGHGGTGHER
jgi:hypothetical protein